MWSPSLRAVRTASETVSTTPLQVMIHADTVNEVNRGLGHRPPYPFEISGAVEDKLAFVHNQLRRVTRADVEADPHRA